jgi:hypothetical protein
VSAFLAGRNEGGAGELELEPDGGTGEKLEGWPLLLENVPPRLNSTGFWPVGLGPCDGNEGRGGAGLGGANGLFDLEQWHKGSMRIGLEGR